MSYSVVWSEGAQRDLRRLDRPIAQRVVRAVDRFATTEHGDITQLTDHDPPEWRLRVGDWRVRFDWDEAGQAITVLHIRHRREAYRD